MDSDIDLKYKAGDFIYLAWYLSEAPITAGGRQEPLFPYPDEGERWLHRALTELKEAGLLPDWFAKGVRVCWDGHIAGLHETVVVWPRHGLAEATQRGFLMTGTWTDRMLQREELDKEECLTFGRQLRSYARGSCPVLVVKWKEEQEKKKKEADEQRADHVPDGGPAQSQGSEGVLREADRADEVCGSGDLTP